jgi:S-adenosylmethionine:tRNA ribosyltransferase-isomerase
MKDFEIAQQIKIEEYDYNLPDNRIAKYPLLQRDQSKLLFYGNNKISETVFGKITDCLPTKSLLVFNNTRVINARILFNKESGAQIEIFCLEPDKPADYFLNFQSRTSCKWKCLIGNQKKWKEGTLKKTISINGKTIILSAQIENTASQENIILFQWDNPDCTFAEIIETAGILPIPPYLNRKTEEIDLQSYQTVYSKIKGSVAAPTAGLHFTAELLKRLENKGFNREEVTLHVGAGTFKPVKTETIGEHEMHAELFSVRRSTIENIINNLGNITAVGTTSVRTLESLYYLGLLISDNKTINPEFIKISQWCPYDNNLKQIPVNEALHNIVRFLNENKLETLTASTQIIITPEYKFKIVNNLITNFHQPKSTLLLLVSAFVNGNWKEIYDYALQHDFRFLSYGDSSLLIGV